jgi:hypothetical protein
MMHDFLRLFNQGKQHKTLGFLEWHQSFQKKQKCTNDNNKIASKDVPGK